MSGRRTKANRQAGGEGQEAPLDKATIVFLNSMARALVSGNRHQALALSMAAIGAEIVARDHANPGTPLKLADIKTDINRWYVDLPEGRIYVGSAATQAGDLNISEWKPMNGHRPGADGEPDPTAEPEAPYGTARPEHAWSYYGVSAAEWITASTPCPRCEVLPAPDKECKICLGYGRYLS